MSNIDQFSIRLLALDSALRQAKFASDEAKLALKELSSRNTKKQEEGKKRTIRLFRSIQKLIIDFNNLRGSFDEEREEKLLEEILKRIRRDVSIYLAWYKKGVIEQHKNDVLSLLDRIKNLDDDVNELLTILKKRVPEKGEFFYAGVDGGGTGCRAVIANSKGEIIGKGKAGPCAPNRMGIISSFVNIMLSIKKAAKNAGLNFKTTYFKRICIGVGGIDVTYTHRRLNELFWKYANLEEKLVNVESAIVINDSLLALYSAFRGEPGVIVIGGTHDLIFGYNSGLEANNNMPDITNNWRENVRLSARVISWHAAQVILKLIKGRKHTILLDEWENAFNNGKIFPRYTGKVSFKNVILSIEPLPEIKATVNITTTEAADASRYVFAAAKKGDEDAIRIIHEGVNSSVLFVTRVAEKIGLHNKRFKVAIVGSTIRNLFTKKRFIQDLKELEPSAIVTKPELEPQVGAIDIAVRDYRFY